METKVEEERQQQQQDSVKKVEIVGIGVGAGVGAAAGSSGGAEEAVVVVPMEMDEVVDGFLYLGSARAAVQVADLRRRGITHVLSVTDVLPLRTQLAFGSQHYLQINVLDVPGEQLHRHLPTALAFIGTSDAVVSKKAQQAGGMVLVHCTAGVSRSASVVLAYLMKAHRLTLKQAFIHVKLRRPCIRPNGGFLEQLDTFERNLHGSSSLTEWELKSITETYRKVWRGDGKPKPLPQSVVEAVLHENESQAKEHDRTTGE